MTLEVQGRRILRVIALPVVVADHDGEGYLVSMLGNNPTGSVMCVLLTGARFSGAREPST